jgi:hypothetical protein
MSVRRSRGSSSCQGGGPGAESRSQFSRGRHVHGCLVVPSHLPSSRVPSPRPTTNPGRSPSLHPTVGDGGASRRPGHHDVVA